MSSSHWNLRYKQAVTAACEELAEMQAPTPTWPEHAAVVVTKHLTPVFRDIRDESKRFEGLLKTVVDQVPEGESVWLGRGIIEEITRRLTLQISQETSEDWAECPWCGERPVVSKHHKHEMWSLIHRCKVLVTIHTDWTDLESLRRRWNTRA